jgi:tetratricopeptide (TPR) repeat protein
MQDFVQTIEDLLNQREIKKAEVVIAKALRTHTTPPYQAQILALRARARLLSARPDDGLADLREVRALLGDETPALLELWGDCHFARFELATAGFADRADTAAAQSTYLHILQTYPDYGNTGWVYYQLGRIHLTQNQVEQAAECFREGLLHPSHIKVLTPYCFERLAFVSFYEARNTHRALGFIHKAIDTYPAGGEKRWLVQAHILRSRILRDAQRYEESLAAAETALALTSASSGEGKMLLAETLLTVGELIAGIDGRERDVIQHLQQFIQLSKKPLGVDVTWSRVHEMLGDAYFKTGQHSAATSAYQSALEFNPYHPWEVSLHYRIARSFYQQGEYERAALAIDRLLETARSDGETVNDYRVYDMLGNALFALKRYDEALTAYRTALQIAPPHADNLDKIRTYHDYALEFSRAL